jgi:hypothetical protein
MIHHQPFTGLMVYYTLIEFKKKEKNIVCNEFEMSEYNVKQSDRKVKITPGKPN